MHRSEEKSRPSDGRRGQRPPPLSPLSPRWRCVVAVSAKPCRFRAVAAQSLLQGPRSDGGHHSCWQSAVLPSVAHRRGGRRRQRAPRGGGVDESQSVKATRASMANHPSLALLCCPAPSADPPPAPPPSSWRVVAPAAPLRCIGLVGCHCPCSRRHCSSWATATAQLYSLDRAVVGWRASAAASWAL